MAPHTANRGAERTVYPLSTNMTDALERLVAFKDEGNVHYKAGELKDAIASYSKGVALLPDAEDSEDEGSPVELDPAMRKQGAIVLCNRAAAYMADSKPIPALADAQRASDVDPSNWKSHWRVGLALMMMKPRLERSEQERPARMRRARYRTPRRCLPAARASYRAAAKLARRFHPCALPCHRRWRPSSVRGSVRRSPPARSRMSNRASRAPSTA